MPDRKVLIAGMQLPPTGRRPRQHELGLAGRARTKSAKRVEEASVVLVRPEIRRKEEERPARHRCALLLGSLIGTGRREIRRNARTGYEDISALSAPLPD